MIISTDTRQVVEIQVRPREELSSVKSGTLTKEIVEAPEFPTVVVVLGQKKE